MTEPVWSSPRWSILEAALSFAGAGLAGTLWWTHRHHVELPCTADGGCIQVANSSHAFVNIGPWYEVSVALLGFLGYLALMTLSMMKLGAETPKAARGLHRLLWAGSAGGTAYSWYLQYIAHFVIQAFCVYCFTSACLMTVLFVVATREAWVLRRAPSRGMGRIWEDWAARRRSKSSTSHRETR